MLISATSTSSSTPSKTRRIIGLDPGLRRTGWGVIDVTGNRLSYVADGVVETADTATTAIRLSTLYRGLVAVLTRMKPDEAVVEETFVNKNAVSTLKLGLARGVVLLAPAEYGLEVAEYSATAVKKAVVGTGRAEKAQIQMMVARLLPTISTTLKADAADALAVAICHAHHRPALNYAAMAAPSRLPAARRPL